MTNLTLAVVTMLMTEICVQHIWLNLVKQWTMRIMGSTYDPGRLQLLSLIRSSSASASSSMCSAPEDLKWCLSLCWYWYRDLFRHFQNVIFCISWQWHCYRFLSLGSFNQFSDFILLWIRAGNKLNMLSGLNLFLHRLHSPPISQPYSKSHKASRKISMLHVFAKLALITFLMRTVMLKAEGACLSLSGSHH